jgi:hypothetical protein
MKSKVPTKKATAQSLPAAAGMTGIPVSKLRQMKNAGCPAFRSGRVYVLELDAWLKENSIEDAQKPAIPGADSNGDPIDKEGWEIERLKAQVQKLRLANQVSTGELVPKAEIREAMARALQPMLDVLDKHLEKHLYNLLSDKLRAALTQISTCKSTKSDE